MLGLGKFFWETYLEIESFVSDQLSGPLPASRLRPLFRFHLRWSWLNLNLWVLP